MNTPDTTPDQSDDHLIAGASPPGTLKPGVQALIRANGRTLGAGAAIGAALCAAVLAPVASGYHTDAQEERRHAATAADQHKEALAQTHKARYDKGYQDGINAPEDLVGLPDLKGTPYPHAQEIAEALGHDQVTTADINGATSTGVDDEDLVVCGQKVKERAVTFAVMPRLMGTCPKDGETALWPKMPKLTGTRLDKALTNINQVFDLTKADVTYAGAYKDVDYTFDDIDGRSDGFIVCFQSPKAGAATTGPDTKITLQVTGTDTCPTKTGTYHDPTNDPNYKAPPTIGEGTFIVGEDIEPGTYKTSGSGCYWARLSSTSGGLGSIIANNYSSGSQVVTIRSSDKAFETRGCGTWTKTG